MSTKTNETDYLMEVARTTGAACATVADGHVLILKKENLKKLLDEGNSEFAVIFVKRSDLNPKN